MEEGASPTQRLEHTTFFSTAILGESHFLPVKPTVLGAWEGQREKNQDQCPAFGLGKPNGCWCYSLRVERRNQTKHPKQMLMPVTGGEAEVIYLPVNLTFILVLSYLFLFFFFFYVCTCGLCKFPS